MPQDDRILAAERGAQWRQHIGLGKGCGPCTCHHPVLELAGGGHVGCRLSKRESGARWPRAALEVWKFPGCVCLQSASKSPCELLQGSSWAVAEKAALSPTSREWGALKDGGCAPLHLQGSLSSLEVDQGKGHRGSKHPPAPDPERAAAPGSRGSDPVAGKGAAPDTRPYEQR